MPCQGFPNSDKGWRRGKGGKIGNFAGGIFLPGGENLRRSDFANLNLFHSCKQHSVDTEHQLKSKLA